MLQGSQKHIETEKETDRERHKHTHTQTTTHTNQHKYTHKQVYSLKQLIKLVNNFRDFNFN